MTLMDETSQEILDGGHDATLDELTEAIQARRKMLATLTFGQLKVGDQVRVTNASKRYLNGATAEVVEKRVTKVTIQFPEDMGQYDPYKKFAGRRWIFPPSCLEKVS